MKPLTIADAATMVLGLQDKIGRSEESRHDHRLRGVLLIAQGLTCPKVSRLVQITLNRVGADIGSAALTNRTVR